MHVHYRPWIGSLYREGGLFGKRVLVLGESHYNDWSGERHDEEASDRDFTIRCIEDVTNPDLGGARFWRRLRDVLGGPEFRHRPMADFYHRVAFYNFVQRPIDGGPRTRPSREQFGHPDNAPAFREVLDELRPERLYVSGKGHWAHLPPREAKAAHPLHCGRHSFEIAVYRLADGAPVFTTCTVHPSSGRYPNDLHEGLRRFVEASYEELDALFRRAGNARRSRRRLDATTGRRP